MRFDSRAYRGPTHTTRRTGLPGRAARGSASPRKATCQVPASDYSQLVQGRRRLRERREASLLRGTHCGIERRQASVPASSAITLAQSVGGNRRRDSRRRSSQQARTRSVFHVRNLGILVIAGHIIAMSVLPYLSQMIYLSERRQTIGKAEAGDCQAKQPGAISTAARSAVIPPRAPRFFVPCPYRRRTAWRSCADRGAQV